MAEARIFPALDIEAPSLRANPDDEADFEEHVAAFLTDFNPIAIHDLAELPLPPGGLWDPTFPPIPDPPKTPIRWRVFFALPSDRDRATEALQLTFPQLSLSTLEVADEDWAARSQRDLTPVTAGGFIVTPPWAAPSSEEHTVIVIEPSMGFGTGHHATTRLCLRALSALDLTGRSVLDLGTGSGVLAIAAALAGASQVIGVDVDQHAIDNALYNVTLNRMFLPPVFERADFRDYTIRSADVVIANLTGGMLRSAAASIVTLVSPGGTLIVSGFDESERVAVRGALGAWNRETSETEEGWVALTLTRRATLA